MTKSIPRCQVVPLADHQATFTVDGFERLPQGRGGRSDAGSPRDPPRPAQLSVPRGLLATPSEIGIHRLEHLEVRHGPRARIGIEHHDLLLGRREGGPGR